MKYDLPTGRKLKNYGFLTFDSEAAVKEALKKDGAEFRGVKLKVNSASAPAQSSKKEAPEKESGRG